ncbi:uncharacterized protein LOC135432587 [Drosophila montana]|uniref:uncharacterized protein LOC135432587 n=1 Tax=Drosophila montana TaxID=40370 RepID=UPI00313DACB9
MEPVKSVEKPKSPTDVAKTVSKGYSDDESDEEFGIAKPLDKIIPSTTPLLPFADRTLQKTDDIVKPFTDLKDDKPQSKLDEKSKSPLDPFKQTLKEYSDDESDEEIGFDKPQDKLLPYATPLVPLAMTTSTITSVSDTRESVDIHIKDVVKLPMDPVKSVEKPKSPTDVANTVSKGYSDDESDEEFGISKPLDKIIPPTTPLLPFADRTLQKTDDIVKPFTDLKDDKPQAKLDEKPMSPLDASKQTLKEYSDDESDEEIGFDKPQDKLLSSTTPLVPLAMTTSKITSVSDTRESVDIHIKDVVKLPMDPVKSVEKPKSPTDVANTVSKGYSDDESDGEIGIAKTPDKPILSTTPLLPLAEKTLQKTDDIVKPFTDLKDDKPQAKLDEKPKSPLDASKQTLKEYSDDESDEEIGFDKPQDKLLSSTTPLVPLAMTTSKITSVSDTRESLDIHIKDVVKLPMEPVTDVAKTVSKGYSDDESDEEFGIAKPLDKIIPSTTPLLPFADRTLQKTDDIVKPFTDLKDDKPQSKLDEKSKSPLDPFKQTLKEYSDDESDEEIGFDKPQDKLLPYATPLVPLAMTTSTITSLSETRESVDIHIKDVVKLPMDPVKSVEKPKSPTNVAKIVSKGYPDDESDGEIGIANPLEKMIPSTTSLLPLAEKALQKTDDIVKPFTDFKDDKPQAKFDEKSKSPLDPFKQTLKKYSDDDCDEEIGFDKPQDKLLPYATPLVPLAMTTSTITSVSETRESVDIHIKDVVKLPMEPVKSIEKPKSPTKVADLVPKEYLDDERDSGLVIVKPSPDNGEKDLAPDLFSDSPNRIIGRAGIDSYPIEEKVIPESFSDFDDTRSVQQIVEETLRAGDAEVQKIINETLKSVQVHRELEHKDYIFTELGESDRSIEEIVEDTLKSAKVKAGDKNQVVNLVEDDVVSTKKEKTECKEVRPIAYFVKLGDEKIDVMPTKTVEMKTPVTKPKTVRNVSAKSEGNVMKKQQVKKQVDTKERSAITQKKSPSTQLKLSNASSKQLKVRKPLTNEPPKVSRKTESRRSVTSSTSTTSSASATSRVISEIHFERSASPASSSIFYESHTQGENSRSTTPRPRVKTDVTKIPYNTSVRSLSPSPKSTRSTKTTSIKQDVSKKARVFNKKVKTEITSKSTKVVEDNKRIKTPTPSATHRYMQPTLAHSMRFGLNADSESRSVTPAPVKSPAPPKSPAPAQPNRQSIYKTKNTISALTKNSSIDQKQQKKLITEKPSVLTKKGSHTESKDLLQSTDRLYKRQISKENKQANVIGSKSQITKTMKTQSATATKSIAYRTSIESDNKLQKKTTSTMQQRTKVPISLSSVTTRASTKLSNKSDETVLRPQIDNKKIVRKTASKTTEGSSNISKNVRSSIEPKLQKQMKDTMNESSTTASGSTSASGSSSSTRRSVRSVMVSRKTDKEKTNMKLSEQKGVISTSTVRVHREPTATTSAVSTVLVDDDSERQQQSQGANQRGFH